MIYFTGKETEASKVKLNCYREMHYNYFIESLYKILYIKIWGICFLGKNCEFISLPVLITELQLDNCLTLPTKLKSLFLDDFFQGEVIVS